MNIKVIITGVTGMVGEGVLLECLSRPEVESIFVIGRKPSGIKHEKVKEIVHDDFFDYSSIKGQLAGYNACFFCLGITSVGVKEDQFTHITYDLTMAFAKTLVEINPDMTFNYVTGYGTDSSEKGRVMWARVKGKTENDLLKLPFKQAYMFRPGYMQPVKGAKNVHTYYKVMGFMYPALRALFPKFVTTMAELGQAMINSVLRGYDKPVLECKDIVKLAKNQ